jgi:hypothetical protein
MFLALGIKSWFLDRTVHKQHHVIFHDEWSNLNANLVVDQLWQTFESQFIQHMLDMTFTLALPVEIPAFVICSFFFFLIHRHIG